MAHVMGTGNERLLLDRPDIFVEGGVEYEGIELIGGRKEKFALPALADGLLLRNAEYKTASANSGLYDPPIEFVPKPLDRITLMQALIRNGGDVSAESQGPIAGFKHEINRPWCPRLMLHTAKLRKHGNKYDFPFGRNIILRNRVEPPHPIPQLFSRDQGSIGIKASLGDAPGEERHGGNPLYRQADQSGSKFAVQRNRYRPVHQACNRSQSLTLASIIRDEDPTIRKVHRRKHVVPASLA